MYVPGHFAESSPDALHAFMRKHPLATIFVSDGAGLAADHVPLTLRTGESQQAVLLGHVARANPLWRKAGAGLDCLVVFQGPQHYISPAWYATKAEDGRVVPTWNYEVVHVQGRICAVDEAPRLRVLLEELTNEHEQARSDPWSVNDAPEEYVAALLRAAVGIRIEIVSMTGKAKLSQNQPQRNQRAVIDVLRGQDDPSSREMAEAIANRLRRKDQAGD